MNISKKTLKLSTIIGVSLLTLILFSAFNNSQAQTNTVEPEELNGYAWSSNIGWISMNCKNENNCDNSNYKVSVDDNGNLSGYGWSSNVGWLQFGGLSGFPSGNGTFSSNAKIDPATGNITGWAKFLGGDDYLSDVSSTTRVDTTQANIKRDTQVHLILDGSSSMDGWHGILSNVITQLSGAINEYFGIGSSECSDLRRIFGGCGNVSRGGGSEYYLRDICNFLGNHYSRDIQRYQEANAGTSWWQSFFGQENNTTFDVNDVEDVFIVLFQNEAAGEYYGGNGQPNFSYNRDYNSLFNNNCGYGEEAFVLNEKIEGVRIINPDPNRSGGLFGQFLNTTFNSSDRSIPSTWSYVNGEQLNPNFSQLSAAEITTEVFEYLVGEFGIESVLIETSTSTTESEGVSDKLAWDGWVSLNGYSYGVEKGVDGKFSGYGWGDDVVGWVDFKYVTTTDISAQCNINETGTLEEGAIKPPSTGDTNDLCSEGEPTNVNQVGTSGWSWSCELDEFDSVDCGATCPNGQWICDDQCIDKSLSCNGNCPDGFVSDGSGNCSCPANTELNEFGNCVSTETIEGEITSFEAIPRIINKGDSCNLFWEVQTISESLIECEITSPNSSSGVLDLTQNEYSFGDVQVTTDYTMSCYPTDGISRIGPAISTAIAKCIVNPNFIEF